MYDTTQTLANLDDAAAQLNAALAEYARTADEAASTFVDQGDEWAEWDAAEHDAIRQELELEGAQELADEADGI